MSGWGKYEDEEEKFNVCNCVPLPLSKEVREIEGLVGWKIMTFKKFREKWISTRYTTSLKRLKEDRSTFEKQFGIEVSVFEQVAKEMTTETGIKDDDLLIIFE